MRLLSLIAAVLCAGCGAEPDVVVAVDSDFVLTKIAASILNGDLLLSSVRRDIDSRAAPPWTLTVPRPEGASDWLDLAVMGESEAGTLEARRQFALSVSGEIRESFCLYSYCAGSHDDACAEGRCDITPSDGDADIDADGAGDAHGEGSCDHDSAAVPEAGPLTLVVERAEVMLERICDLDGNGALDNAMADLGSPGGELLAGALNLRLEQSILDFEFRVLIHSPRVDDLGLPEDPDATFIVLTGRDDDEDPENDFSGEGQFLADWYWHFYRSGTGGSSYLMSVDACGEPLFVWEHTSIACGELSASRASLLLPTIGPGRSASIWGRLDPRGRSARLDSCSALLIRDLGMAQEFWAGLSALESILAGGAPYGIPTLPGLAPDLDLDGDGLEQLFLDETSHVASCLDGDGTVIEGPDCSQDPRMADAFSMNLRFEAVSARFSGLEDGWQHSFDEPCAEEPDPSLWDPR